MILKVTSKSQFRLLRELVLISAIYMCTMIFFYVKVELELFKIFFLSSLLLYFTVFFLPVYILHTNYLKSKHKFLKIQEGSVDIDGHLIRSNDIEKINVVATHQHFDGYVGASALPYNDYYYYIELHLIDGKSIILSSLLDYKLDKIFQRHFKNVMFIEVVTSFPIISKKSKIL